MLCRHKDTLSVSYINKYFFDSGAMLDSARMTFYTISNVVDVQLTDKTNNVMWNYGGKKQ